MSGIGLETNNAAADYIALYNGDQKTLADSLVAIQQTSARILDDLLPSERVVDSQTKAARDEAPGAAHALHRPDASLEERSGSRHVPSQEQASPWDR